LSKRSEGGGSKGPSSRPFEVEEERLRGFFRIKKRGWNTPWGPRREANSLSRKGHRGHSSCVSLNGIRRGTTEKKVASKSLLHSSQGLGEMTGGRGVRRREEA